MNDKQNLELEKVISVMEFGGANVLLIGNEGKVIVATKPFAEMFAEKTGIQIEAGRVLLDDIRAKEHNMPVEWLSIFLNGLEGKEVASVLFFKKENRNCYWEIRFQTTYHADGTQCILALTRDITRQRKAENKLIEQNKELKKINSELDRFVYSASHDLRSPLMSIKGLANLIKVEEYNKDNFDSYIEYIERSITKLDNFISDIVHYSHNSRLEVKVQPIDFDYLITQSVGQLKYLSELNTVRIETNIDPVYSFFSDHDRLMIVMINIISNGIIYLDPYKVDPYLKITVNMQPDKATLKLEDNGVGIAEQHMDKVVQMFFRGNAKSRGSGLGLYIANEITEKLSGTLSLESKVGIGTTILIELPNLGSPSGN
jgi:signal transduction histidine kinase